METEKQPEEVTCTGGITLRLSAGDIWRALQEQQPREGDPE
jgi:hypothetical protein